MVMSASTGTLRNVSGSSLRSAAVISGSAAFFAPPMGIVPESGLPPRMRILSMLRYFLEDQEFLVDQAVALKRTLPLPPRGGGMGGGHRVRALILRTLGALARLGFAPKKTGAQRLGLALLSRGGSAFARRAQLRLFRDFLGHGSRVTARPEGVKVAKQARLVYLRARALP